MPASRLASRRNPIAAPADRSAGPTGLDAPSTLAHPRLGRPGPVTLPGERGRDKGSSEAPLPRWPRGIFQAALQHRTVVGGRSIRGCGACAAVGPVRRGVRPSRFLRPVQPTPATAFALACVAHRRRRNGCDEQQRGLQIARVGEAEGATSAVATATGTTPRSSAIGATRGLGRLGRVAPPAPARQVRAAQGEREREAPRVGRAQGQAQPEAQQIRSPGRPVAPASKVRASRSGSATAAPLVVRRSIRRRRRPSCRAAAAERAVFRVHARGPVR